MATTCGCEIKIKNGVPCPWHGFADKLDKAARTLRVALKNKSGIGVATQKLDAVLAEMLAARHSWSGR